MLPYGTAVLLLLLHTALPVSLPLGQHFDQHINRNSSSRDAAALQQLHSGLQPQGAVYDGWQQGARIPAVDAGVCIKGSVAAAFKV
jgi:hypothetical protein